MHPLTLVLLQRQSGFGQSLTSSILLIFPSFFFASRFSSQMRNSSQEQGACGRAPHRKQKPWPAPQTTLRRRRLLTTTLLQPVAGHQAAASLSSTKDRARSFSYLA